MQSYTCSGMQGTLQPPLRDTPNPCVGSLWAVHAWRCSAANGNSIATKPKGPRPVCPKTDGYMILLQLLLGVCVRYAWTAWEDVICAPGPLRA